MAVSAYRHSEAAVAVAVGEPLEGDDFCPGMVEHFERLDKAGARKRPAAEGFETAVVDEHHRHLRPWRTNPAQAEPQVQRCGLPPAEKRMVGKDREQQRHDSGAYQGQAGRAHSARQRHGGTSYKFVRLMKSSNSARVHTLAATGSLPASTRAPPAGRNDDLPSCSNALQTDT